VISPCKSQGRMVAVVDSKLEEVERLLRRLPPPPPPTPSVKLVDDDKEHGVGGGEQTGGQTVLIGLGTCTEKNSDGNGCANAVSGGEGPGHDQDGKGRSRSGGGLSRPPPGPYESRVRCCNLDCPQVNGDGLSEDASLDGMDGVASTDLCLRRAG
jgi:hypothetical protein